MEEIINSPSAYTEPGMNMVSAEQILSLTRTRSFCAPGADTTPRASSMKIPSTAPSRNFGHSGKGEGYSLAATPCKS
ncbi:hypothetical protein ACSAZL_02290 [Methanosarcina sp. T3]|uniref:hypothetical protein n=1 Tax=Methanosarcina sp. T3 TaxID=3439062 RepID=UPI003F836149